jgi:cystathionine beta-lyase
MLYDFDKVIDRSNNYASKYDERTKKFGTQDVLPLWVADMDFKTAQPIIDALVDRAHQGIFGYTSRPDSYFDAICDWQQRRHGWRINKSWVSFSTGVVPTLSAIVHQFSEPGDKILIQTPVYPEFEDSIRAWNRELLVSPLLEKGGVYTVDFDQFEQALRQQPKCFILCSPHNPVGRVWTREELLQMCRLCVKYGVRIVSDEIHSDLVMWGNKHIPTATLSDEIAAATIACISGTKTFNLAGLQASTTVVANAKDKDHFDKFWKNLAIHRNNCFSLVAMEAAFRHGEEWLTQLLAYLEGNIRFVHDTCAQQIPAIKPNIPESTYLIWLDCRGLGMSDAELADFMIKKARLGMNSGASFGKGGEGYMRLNAACPRSVLAQALTQLRTAVTG